VIGSERVPAVRVRAFSYARGPRGPGLGAVSGGAGLWLDPGMEIVEFGLLGDAERAQLEGADADPALAGLDRA
jgi:hypothetical protein